MSLLLGIERCKIDANGRFKLPVALKRQVATDDNRYVLRRSVYANCLELWTYASFEEEVALLNKTLNRYKKEDVALLRQLVRCNIIELDTNDRLLIPAEQKDLFKNSKEIVLQSVGRFIEIWDYDTYSALDADMTDIAALVDQRLGNLKDENDSEAK